MEPARKAGSLSALQGLNVFKGLSRRELARLASLCREERRASEEVLGRQGDEAEEAYVILAGSVGLFREEEGEEVPVGILREGEMVFFGSLEVPTFPFTLRCRTSTRVLVIPREVLWVFMERNPSWGYQVWQRLNDTLCRRIQELHELVQIKTRSVQMVSHELKSCLTAVQGYCDLLAASRLERKRIERLTRELKVAVGRLSRLIGDLVRVGRTEADPFSMEKRLTSIKDLIEETVRGRIWTPSFHHIQLRIPDDLPLVEVDPERIAQVLCNLVDNAIKYSPGGGEVLIAASYQGGEIQVCVTDQGIGIPLEWLGQIFERSSRVPGPLRDQVEGMGLGLLICKQIVRAHGGHIWAMSQVGKGSTFYFTLPVTTKVEPARKAARETA